MYLMGQRCICISLLIVTDPHETFVVLPFRSQTATGTQLKLRISLLFVTSLALPNQTTVSMQ